MPHRTAIALLFVLQAATARAQNAPDQNALAEFFRSGIAALEARKFADAETSFRKMLELDPANLAGVMGVAQTFMAQSREDDAIRFAVAEAANNPRRPDLTVVLGDLAVRARLYNLALEQFRKVLSAMDFKGSDTFYVHRGGYGADPLTDSLSALGGGDHTPKGAAGLFVRMSEVSKLKGDLPEAIATLRRAREADPRSVPVALDLAMELEASGQKTEAMAAYREALTLDPSNALTLNNLAFLIGETGGDLYEALRYARRARLARPESPEIADTLGWISLKQGFVDDAVMTFSALVSEAPENALFRQHLLAAIGKKAVRSPQTDELRAALQEAPSEENIRKLRTLLQPPGKK